MYIPRNWEFGLTLAKLRNFGRGEGGGFEPPNPPSVCRCPEGYVNETAKTVAPAFPTAKFRREIKLVVCETRACGPKETIAGFLF
jgi:hypothetical protein